MESFGVLLIAVDDYPDPPGPLPSSQSADRLAELIIGERGGTLVQRLVAKSREDINGAFEKWAAGKEARPQSTIVYLVGHGTDDGLDHSFMAPAEHGVAPIRTASFRPVFEEDWIHRQGDQSSWTLFVLDCCAADVGLTNLEAALSQHAPKRPRRLAMWPTTPQGASHSGRFVGALSRILGTFTENDASIPLNEVFRRMLPDLGSIEPLGFLPDAAVLKNPLHSPKPIVMNLDAHEELRRIISELPSERRSHFLNKAQGAETGELAWFFKGREKEIRTLCAWLRDAPVGLRVVTGAAGSGKSALLGHLSVLADDELVEAYARAELALSLRAGPRPPYSVFDATIHLTGKTLADVLDSIYAQVQEALKTPLAAGEAESAPMQFWAGTPSELIRYLRGREQHITVLADALDEAQEPLLIANLLRILARSGVAKVVVGTRRSLSEGPDQPYDPDHNELIDALEASREEIIVIENDREATHSYVVQRLGTFASPYADQTETIRALADRIASLDQPFLFARLATSELLARPALKLDDPELKRMLDAGHAGIFGVAVARIEQQNPAVGTMLRALAFGRGRGLPESGGTWVAIARGIGGDLITSDTVRTTIKIAAPYITLDGEAGQSTYRLAHQTFVEYFAQPRLGFFESAGVERAIAAALLELAERSGGWATANYYWFRYLPAHLESGLQLEGLAELTTNPGWLRRAIELLGVDRTINSIAGGGLCLSPVASVVQKALRRCRIALSRDPGQLAGQMQARLRNNSDARLARLGSALAANGPYTTLQMRQGSLDWMADLETTYGLVGKVRALAFGQVDCKTVLAIGVDEQIHLWNPLQGSDETRVFDNEGRRVNALAFAELDGRPVLVVASCYDDQLGVIRNASTGEQIGEPFPLATYVDSLAMGLLDGRLAVVGSGNGQLVAWDFHARIPMTPPETLGGTIVCVSEFEGRIIACVLRGADHNLGAWIVDVATGADLWPNPMRFDGGLSVVAAGYSAQEGLILGGYVNRKTIVTWSPKEPKELNRIDISAEFDVPVRALAVVVEVDALNRQKAVALAPDYESTALVRLCQIDLDSRHVEPQRFVSGPTWIGSEILAVFASDDGKLQALTDSPLALHDLTSDGSGPPLDINPDQATISFAITGRWDTKAVFVGDDDRRLWRPPSDPKASSSGSLRVRAAFRLDEPGEWPRSAWAWGQVGDTAAVATGSVAGAAWIWDPVTGHPIAGPLATVSPQVLERGWSAMGLKGSPSCVESLALGRHPHHGDIIALAIDGRVRMYALPGGEELPTPAERATVITSVGLGRMREEDVLVTGSKGGVLILWGLASGSRIAALTLDKEIDRVWVVHGAEAVAVRARTEIYVLDVVIGKETSC